MRDEYTYSKEFVYDSKNGVFKNMAGKLTWRIGYFIERWEKTGEEIYAVTFGDPDAAEDVVEEVDCNYRKEISKEEYERRNDAE